MIMIKDFILAFVATIGFAIIFEVKKKNLLYVGACGGIGWIVYIFMLNFYGIFISTFISSLTIVILARIFAKLCKTPTLIFYIPGIFPIVPGAGIYNTAYSIVINNFADAKMYGLNTIKTSCAIVLAIAIISLFPYSIKKMKK